jgi:lipopolysaccharide/colanic/teichoic acid biosynthesis glycosyltransferase
MGASALLVLALPMLAIALAVRLFLGRPVLFAQDRPGLGGRPFRLYKFRTMLRDLTNGEPVPDAHRMTRFGSLLRSTSLDELPELWNVVRGDMSLVGPRPLLMEYLPLYSAEQARRHEVRPGITGWAQVNGRNAIDWEERFALDVWYVEHRTFRLDMWILLRTIARVAQRSGVQQAGEATMRRFDDSGRKG